MEDLDTPRVVPGCADAILRTLESFGLTWDGDVLWQSRRTERLPGGAGGPAVEGAVFRVLLPASAATGKRGAGISGHLQGQTRPARDGAHSTATRFRIDDDIVTARRPLSGSLRAARALRWAT